jgi:L-ascorbate metabolism protein UlaG (beta-lactamase superfamily)
VIRRHPNIVIALCLLALSPLLRACTSATLLASDHSDGRRFHNRDLKSAPEPTFWEEVKVAWVLKTKHQNWPERFESTPTDVPKEPVLRGFRVLWIGHAGTLIQTPTLNILTDPILFDRIDPRLFPTKTVTHPGVRLESLPHIDLILISHDHYDHLDLKSIHAICDRQPGNPPTFLVGLGVGAVLKKAGISSYTELDWNDSLTVKDTKVYFLEAVHTSRRSISDTNKALWGSFLIDSPHGRVYFAGDTAYGKHFKDIYERFGAPTISLLPIGAYEPRWFMYRMHMNPNDAVLAHQDLHSQHSIAIHFGLLDMASEGYDAPVQDLAVARKTHGVEETAFVAPHIGEVFDYDAVRQ